MNKTNDFYIVGIGASAGGYEALKGFFSQIPEKPGASFVVIQHFDRNFKSLTKEWLSKYTGMKILTVHDTTKVEPNYIYLMPKDKILRMKDGNLVVSERESQQAVNLSIDIFFQSLGEVVKEKAVGVILSGTGTDGSRGIVTIKENGGIVLVQQPDMAELDGMPRVAIAAGHPDLVQPPDKLADQLLRHIQNPFQFDETKLDQMAKTDNNIIQDIIERVSEYSRVNFRGYKINTIIRRIERRTKLNNLESLAQYHNFLQNNPKEIKALYNDLLIGVTAFFRDPDAFEALEKQVIPALFEKRKRYETVRIWVVACSTGEEAYSVAMLCDEYVQRHQLDVPYKIFATDIDDRSLEVASIGRYNQSIAADISPERLRAYFKKSDDFYNVKKVIREKIIFARHNLTVDPPFLNLNLITCRNLFIYLKSDLQKKILYNFNFALRSNGYLFLGANETTDSEQELFDTVDAQWKILRCKPEAKSRPRIFESVLPTATANSTSEPTKKSQRAVQRSLSQDTRYEEILLQEFAPASILLNSEHEVVYSHGNAEKFLQFPNKRMSLNVFHMVSGSTATLFRNGIRKVASRDNLVFRNVDIEEAETPLTADIFFKIVKHHDDEQQFVLVHFVPVSGKAEQKIVEEAVNETIPYQDVRELELELEYTKKELLYSVDELETLNQELQATNKEMRSSNEELQATNEEMQSSNEELHTVNTELQLKLDEISSLHNDINNLVNNTELVIIFLDEELKIRMFTPAAKTNFSFMEKDIGRPLSHLSHNFLYYNFTADTRSVLETHRPIEKEIEDANGRFYLMRVLPYKTERHRIKGVVITFIDITQLKLVASDLQQRTCELEESERNCRTLVNNTPDIIARYNDKLELIYINEALEKHLGLPAANIIGKPSNEITIPDSKQEIDNWIASVEKAFATKHIVHDYFRYGEGASEKHFYSSFVPEFCPDNMHVLSVLSISREVTDLKQHERLIKEQNKQLKKINNDLDNFVYTASHDLKTPILNIEGLKNILHEKIGTRNDAEEIEVMELMDRSISKFKSTINHLTNISKVQKNIQFEEEDVALEEVLSDVKADIKSLIVSSGARIDADFQVEHIRYARYYLRSILYNLLSNAIKYRSDAPAQISIQTYRKGDAVVLRVTDNGLGLDESQVPELFKMFKRFHDHVDGSGIGLYIVNRIVENNEGKIQVESAVGKGTTFSVYFK